MRTGNLKPNRNFGKFDEVANASPNITINGSAISVTGTGGVSNILGGVYGQFITIQQKPGPTGTVIFDQTGNIKLVGSTLTLAPGETRCFYYDSGFDKWLDVGQPGRLGPDGFQGFDGAEGAIGDTGMFGTTGDQGVVGPDGAGGPIGDDGVKGTTGVDGGPGENGPNGADGDLGVTGQQGPTGETGQQGPPCSG